MKLVTFEKCCPKLGAKIDDKILDLKATYDAVHPEGRGKRMLSSMIAYLNHGETAFDTASKVVKFAEENPDKAVWREGELLAPIPRPPKLLLLAGNYAEHVREGGGEAPEKETTTPRVFMKPPDICVIATEEPIIIPKNPGWIDWEAELGVVIGKRGKYISADEAYDYVAGYTIVNDISERTLQIDKEREEREGDDFFDWLIGKWFDTFAPMGPCMVTKDEIPNPHDLRISLSVNGVTEQNSNTGNMIFYINELIEFISQYITLVPGDVISTGTPEGIGVVQGKKLQAGDVVEVEIEKIGLLRNPVEQG